MDYIRLASLILTGALSNTEIGYQCNVYRGSVPKYRQRLQDAGITRVNLSQHSENAIKTIINPPRKTPKCQVFDEPDWARILPELNKSGSTNAFHYEDYRKNAQYPMSNSTFNRRLRKALRKRGPVMRTQHRPGYQVFVDFSGKRPGYDDPKTGKHHKVELFVACLGQSKLAFAYATRSQKTEDWIRAHVAMFDYFGGVPSFVVPDNLKAAVITSRKSVTGVSLNPRYLTMLTHYGCNALPARPNSPRDKGLVENAVLHLKRWILYPLSRQKFFSLEEINEAIRPLLERINEKPMRRAGNLSRRDLFELEERKHLGILPLTPFRNAMHLGCRVVPEDYHLLIHGAYYSVPHRLIGSNVEVFETNDTFEIYHQIERVAVHLKATSAAEVRTIPSHMPENHLLYARHRERHFATWGALQPKPIRDYLRAHLQCWKNPNATENASKRLQRLADQFGIDHLNTTVAMVMKSVRRENTTEQAHLHVRRIQNLLSRPAALRLHEEDASDQSPIEHDNIRGAEYYE